MKLFTYLSKLKYIFTSFYRVYFSKDDKVNCLICGWKGKSFFERARCPKCGSLSRARLIPYAIDYFKIPMNGSRLLHVSPNSCEFTHINKNYSLEIYDRLDIMPKKKLINVVADLTSIPKNSKSYDNIIIWHVLEHIPNDLKAIKEMYRVLSENGRVLISVPIFPPDNEITFEDKAIPYGKYLETHGHPDHCRSCGLDYYKRFEDAGFKVRTLEVKKIASPDTIAKYGLSPNHVCWLAEKSE